MRKIPEKLKERLAHSFIHKRCALEKSKQGSCTGRIQWHHVFIYGGRQINEFWAILGACVGHHDRVTKEKAVREAFEKISLEYATPEDLAKYPRKDWGQIKSYLKIK